MVSKVSTSRLRHRNARVACPYPRVVAETDGVSVILDDEIIYPPLDAAAILGLVVHLGLLLM